MNKLGSEKLKQTTRIKEYFPVKPAERHVSIIIETPRAIHGKLNQAYLLGCFSKGDLVELKYKDKTYTATFKEMYGRPFLVADGCEYPSFSKFIQAMIDTKSIGGSVYNNLKVNSMSWKEFCEEILFFNSVMQIKKELQFFLDDPNVRDIFYGREELEKASTEVSIYENQNLYVVVDRLPEERLKFVGEFPIVYISWGILTDYYPFNPPKIPFPLETLKKFDNILDTHLGLDFRSKYINLTAIALDWK
ncbi:17165_t:CDS:1, partial [Funneliformis caledonium]